MAAGGGFAPTTSSHHKNIMNITSDFINWMTSQGCEPANPSEIKADNTRHYYQLIGDKPTIEKGSYWLKIDGDFVVGWAVNLRTGEKFNYTNKSKIKWTDEQKAEYKIKSAEHQKKQEEQEKKSRAEAAKNANKIWKDGETSGEHPYLTKKKIGIHHARISGSELIIPVRIDKKITSLQFIDETGDKRFLLGGAIKGGYCTFCNNPADLSKIIICEGWATGATVFEATGITTLVAFNAGNLKPVAIKCRAEYPDAKLIFAADNDWEKLRDGKNKVNVGIDAANQAAATIGGAVVLYPPELDGISDFNDLYCFQGAEAVKEVFSVLGKEVIILENDIPSHMNYYSDIYNEDSGEERIDEELPPIEAYNDDARPIIELFADTKIKNKNWRELLGMDGKGTVRKTMQNTLVFLENDPVLSNLFCYDEFCREKVIYRCPPWEQHNIDKFNVRPVNDSDCTMLTVELERRGAVQPFATVERLLNAIISKNTRNPATEFFNSLKWDGVPRLDTWLIKYLRCEQDDYRYLSAIGRKWLVAAVTRVFNAGAKFDHMLILGGKQRIGKSLILRELGTFRGKSFFLDTVTIDTLGTRETTMMLQGKIIIEFPELTNMNRADVRAIKQTVSSQDDRCQPKYSNNVEIYPRQFVLAATYNPDGVGIFTDPTGNERFWVATVGDSLDIEGIRRDKEQLWAEAIIAYKAGEKLYLEGELAEIAREMQGKHMAEEPWEADLLPIIKDVDKIFVKDIWRQLGITDITKKTKTFQNDISRIMTRYGFEKARLRKAGQVSEPAWRRVQKSILQKEEELLEF